MDNSANHVLLLVRSVVNSPQDRAGFDHWYSTDHMPKAIGLLGVEEGWRYWSLDDPSVHIAIYRYRDEQAFRSRSAANVRALMDEYESIWPQVTRTRELIAFRDEYRP